MWQSVIDQLLKALQAQPGQVGQPQFSPQQSRTPQMSGVGMPRRQSAGLFDQYMQSNMMRRYNPPMMQGGPFQNFGGFSAFGAPKMNTLTGPAQQQGMGMRVDQPGNVQGMPSDQYFGIGVNP